MVFCCFCCSPLAIPPLTAISCCSSGERLLIGGLRLAKRFSLPVSSLAVLFSVILSPSFHAVGFLALKKSRRFLPLDSFFDSTIPPLENWGKWSDFSQELPIRRFSASKILLHNPLDLSPTQGAIFQILVHALSGCACSPFYLSVFLWCYSKGNHFEFCQISFVACFLLLCITIISRINHLAFVSFLVLYRNFRILSCTFCTILSCDFRLLFTILHFLYCNSHAIMLSYILQGTKHCNTSEAEQKNTWLPAKREIGENKMKLQKEVIIKALENEGFNVEPTTVIKNGIEKEAINYRSEGSNVGVNAYLDDYETEAEAIENMKKLFSKPIPTFDITAVNKSQLTARIYAVGNAGTDLVRPFNDLEICLAVRLDADTDGESSFKLTKNLLNHYGLDEEEAFKVALENCYKESETHHINKMLSKLSGVSEEQLNQMFGQLPMWVLTNKNQVHGAIEITNTEALSDLAEFVGGDLWVLPSSIHEVIAVPVSLGEPEGLRMMVGEVNQTEVKAEEILTENVYRFNRDNKTVTIA